MSDSGIELETLYIENLIIFQMKNINKNLIYKKRKKNRISLTKYIFLFIYIDTNN